jgi:hypothetical protein
MFDVSQAKKLGKLNAHRANAAAGWATRHIRRHRIIRFTVPRRSVMDIRSGVAKINDD